MEGPGHPGDIMYGFTCVEIEDYILGSDTPDDVRFLNKTLGEIQQERFDYHLGRYHQQGCRECEPGVRRNTFLGHGEDPNDYMYDLTCGEIDETRVSMLPPDQREETLSRYLAKYHQESCEDCYAGIEGPDRRRLGDKWGVSSPLSRMYRMTCTQIRNLTMGVSRLPIGDTLPTGDTRQQRPLPRNVLEQRFTRYLDTYHKNGCVECENLGGRLGSMGVSGRRLATELRWAVPEGDGDGDGEGEGEEEGEAEAECQIQ